MFGLHMVGILVAYWLNGLLILEIIPIVKVIPTSQLKSGAWGPYIRLRYLTKVMKLPK